MSFWIFWYDINVTNEENKRVALDLTEAGFKIRPFKNIEESKEYLKKNGSKQKYKLYSIICISSGSLKNQVISFI